VAAAMGMCSVQLKLPCRVRTWVIAGSSRGKARGVTRRILHWPIDLVRYSSVSCMMPVVPTMVLVLKGPVFCTRPIQADITVDRSLNLDFASKCHQRPLSISVRSCN